VERTVEKGALISIVFQGLPIEDWCNPIRRLDKGSSTKNDRKRHAKDPAIELLSASY
jgi:hypothetical protein